VTYLRLREVAKSYDGRINAVDDVSIDIERGEFVTFLGPSGSGKTTLLNLIAGTIRSDAGTIRIGGEDVTRLPNHLRVRKRINRTFQLVRMPPNLPAIVGVMAGVAFNDAGVPRAAMGVARTVSQAAETAPRRTIGREC
jgi:branched-chain amino acid transport system ATP-binding protein